MPSVKLLLVSALGIFALRRVGSQIGLPCNLENVTILITRGIFAIMEKFESSDKIKSIIDWSESRGIYHTMWGNGEEIKLKPHTWRASQMDVRAFCGDMDFVVIYIGLSPYNSYNDRYSATCDYIFDEMGLSSTGIDMIGISGIMCLGFGVNWRGIKEEQLREMIEFLAKKVSSFRGWLDDYGYVSSW